MKTVFFISLLILVVPLIHPGQGHYYRNSSYGENISVYSINKVYESLQEPDLNPHAFHIAMLGFRLLYSKGLVAKDSLVTIIDYSLPSSDDRFFVVNLNRNKVIYKTFVSHGRNSGDLYASRFSNNLQSHQSALGFYITGSPYHGGQGYSMTLAGVDTGYNDHASVRSIVVHGADYVTERFISRYGRLGRSFGCPALPPALNSKIIDYIKEGSVLLSYYPDQDYMYNSRVLGSVSATHPAAKTVY